MKKQIIILILLLFLLQQAYAAILDTIGGVNTLLYGIAAGIAALMIAMHAVRWKTAENPGEREDAKKGLINVMLALILIMIAASLVSVLFVRPPEGEAPPTTTKSSTKTTTSTTKLATTTTTSSGTTTTRALKTVACTNSLECWEKMGICWVCEKSAGECLTIDRETKTCPDCSEFNSSFSCFYARNNYGPHCCYWMKEKNVDPPLCKDGTPIGSCSSKYPGLRCKRNVTELMHDPSCPGIYCTDTDGGKDPLVKGECSDVIRYYAYWKENIYNDACIQRQLTETSCQGNECIQEQMACPSGTACIVSGACV